MRNVGFEWLAAQDWTKEFHNACPGLEFSSCFAGVFVTVARAMAEP
jgi:hypothetical protein